MKKTLRVLATLSILASSMLFAQSASGIGTLYSPETRSGDVPCTTSGWFSISNNVVFPNSNNCRGTANIPLGVTGIGYRAFYEVPLSEVTIPSSVTSIGETAFEFSTLASINIPNTVTSIGNAAFRSSAALTSVTLGSGITAIPVGAFQSASNLTSITIPNSVLSIGGNAFYGASSLTSITIPDSVTTIGSNAFRQATALHTVVIGNGVTTIEGGAFSGLSSLSNLSIGSSVTVIGDYAFTGPNRLTSITFPDTLTSIGERAFKGPSLLTSITLPNSLTRLGDFAFGDSANESNTYLSSFRFCGTRLNPSYLSWASLGSTTRTSCPATITSGDLPNSKVATFTSGITVAEIPVSNELPAIKLAFTGTAPASLTVAPYTNPAPPSRTPFMTSGSPKIVDINISGGHDGSNVKICLDGNSDDHLYHYTGGQWVELPSRTYENNQVCGITNSFSPFVAAPVSPLTVPGAPTIGTATATGTTTASVDFTAPASDGGTPIRSYTATSTPGGITGGVTQSGSGTISITGLSPSTAYTFTVTANNLIGDSVASSASNSTSTVGVPSAPTSIVATSTGKRSAIVKLANSASNGGSNITSYTITASPGGLSKTFTIGSPTTLAYEFLNLVPNTSYLFYATAINSIGTSAATISNSIKTDALVPATLSSVTFIDDGTGTSGKLAWSGKNIDAVLYTGPAASYPGPFTFGAFSTTWNGTIRNLTPDTQYTISIFAISPDGIGESKSLTFKTSSGVLTDAPKATAQVSSQLNQVISWINLNSFTPGEAANINNLLTKFDALVTSAHRSYIKVPTSRVSKVEVKSLTPKVCSVVSATAKVDAGLVTALTKDTCTISYTVSGSSKAPATMLKDFVFKKVS